MGSQDDFDQDKPEYCDEDDDIDEEERQVVTEKACQVVKMKRMAKMMVLLT